MKSLQTLLHCSSWPLFISNLTYENFREPSVLPEATESLVKGLEQHGVDESDLSFWAHAERMYDSARDLDPNHDSEYYKMGLATERMYLLMRAAMGLVATGEVPSGVKGFQNVLELAVDSVRDTYAYWSLAARDEGDVTSK